MKAKPQRLMRMRNLHASAPIMRKGGPHVKSGGARRAAAKKECRKNVANFLHQEASGGDGDA